jgi:hypothetical protein
MRTRFMVAGLPLVLLCSCGSESNESEAAAEGNTGGSVGSGGGPSSSGGDSNPIGTGGGVDSSGTGGDSNPRGSGGSTATLGCDRAGLEAAASSYLAALQAGDPTIMPLAAGANYVENESSSAFGQGVWQAPVPVDFHRNLLDVQRCGTFTEVIAANASHPYVLGARLQVQDGQITEVEVVATDEGDWLFDADAYLQYSSGEDWSPVPEGERLTYEELRDGAEAYFAYWGDRSVEVPWGTPCARLEGGAYTGDFAGSSCDVGVPDQGFAPQPRDHLVDVDYGMVVLLLNLGGADSHLFRILDTGIRYVHTLTVQ